MIDLLQQSNTYQSLVETLTAQFSGSKCAQTSINQQINHPEPWLRGLHGASTAYLLSALAADFADKSFLVVVPTQHEAEKIVQDLPAYHFEEPHLFPQWQNFLYDGIPPTKKCCCRTTDLFVSTVAGRFKSRCNRGRPHVHCYIDPSIDA